MQRWEEGLLWEACRKGPIMWECRFGGQYISPLVLCSGTRCVSSTCRWWPLSRQRYGHCASSGQLLTSKALGATDLRLTRTERKLLVGPNTRRADTRGAPTREIGLTHQVIWGHFKFWHSCSKPQILQHYTKLYVFSFVFPTFTCILVTPTSPSSVSKPPRKHRLYKVAGVPHLIIVYSLPPHGANPATGYQASHCHIISNYLVIRAEMSLPWSQRGCTSGRSIYHVTVCITAWLYQ